MIVTEVDACRGWVTCECYELIYFRKLFTEVSFLLSESALCLNTADSQTLSCKLNSLHSCKQQTPPVTL